MPRISRAGLFYAPPHGAHGRQLTSQQTGDLDSITCGRNHELRTLNCMSVFEDSSKSLPSLTYSPVFDDREREREREVP